jgi:LysM repeat protein
MPGQSLCLGTAGQDCTDTYVVQPNDTCEEVANANKVDLGVLYQNNPQLNNPTCNNMYVGEVCVLGLST